jgi:hypothetical protein
LKDGRAAHRDRDQRPGRPGLSAVPGPSR